MKKISFNTGWTCNGTPVTLPHDAQITEPRSAGASDGGHAYFPGMKRSSPFPRTGWERPSCCSLRASIKTHPSS